MIIPVIGKEFIAFMPTRTFKKSITPPPLPGSCHLKNWVGQGPGPSGFSAGKGLLADPPPIPPIGSGLAQGKISNKIFMIPHRKKIAACGANITFLFTMSPVPLLLKIG